MPKQTPVGEQLTSEQLHQRQKQLRNTASTPIAPTVITSQLHTPENLGSVFRLADAAGCQQVIVIHDADPSKTKAKKAVRTARNCEKHLDIQYWSMEKFLTHYVELQPILALEITTHSENIFTTSLPQQCSFLLGHERHGIEPRLLNLCVKAIHIPMFGVNSSMNVSHALAITLFEWRRQNAIPTPV